METKIKIRNEAELCIIDIEGIIGIAEESQFGDDSQRVATYDRFRTILEQLRAVEAKEVVVNIRSTGGDVNDALLIYEALVALEAKVTTRCYGYTASAATIIAQAASVGCREISASALYLIHSSSCSVEGNAADLADSLALLRKTDERISQLYAARSGGEAATFAEIMAENGGRGRWLSPDEVVELALADKVIGGEEKPHGVVDMVKEWLSPRKKQLPNDINILHAPTATQTTTSLLPLDEGQRHCVATALAQVEDPSLDEPVLSHNAAAYAEDIKRLRLLQR